MAWAEETMVAHYPLGEFTDRRAGREKSGDDE
jgi:hypothetical protein